ncbi:hypothetical protein F7725_009415, partial [Dissostichus mawsoni]
MSSLENVPLGPCVHPVKVVTSWMGPRLVDSHHLRMVSSEHSTGSLMSLSLLGSRCLKMSFALPLVEEPGVDHSKDDGVPEDVHVPASGLHGDLYLAVKESNKSTLPMYL